MAYNPGVSFFIPFSELDPSKQRRCIYFTQKGTRCKWLCHDKDNQRAVILQNFFLKTPIEAINIETLREYAQCNCCVSARAQHQDRIEDVGLLTPLAQRWLKEIRAQEANSLSNKATFPCVKQGKTYSYVCNIIGTSSTSSTRDVKLAIANSSFRDRSHIATSSGTVKKSSSICEISQSCPDLTLGSSNTPGVTFHGLTNHSRHEFRTRQTNGSRCITQTQSSYTAQISLSEFRPHIVEPSLSDSVYQKMLEPLEDRDFETGALYTFDRISSPGHVKIGWTAKTISARLKTWSKCGNEPNLLFSMSRIPHAQRVETLTHHELIKEWRRERRCKAPWCGKSHREWFEISREQAEQVLSDWACFIKMAKPYDSNGLLEIQWKEVIEKIHRKTEVVTAKNLLGLYKASLMNEGNALAKNVDLSCAPRIVEITSHCPEVNLFKASKDEFVCGISPRMEHPELSNDMALGKSEVAWKNPEGGRLVETRPSGKIKSMFEGAPVLGIIPVKREPTPEQILLGPSPSVEPTGPRIIASSLQCTQQDPGVRSKQLSAQHVVTKANAKMTIVMSFLRD